MKKSREPAVCRFSRFSDLDVGFVSERITGDKAFGCLDDAITQELAVGDDVGINVIESTDDVIHKGLLAPVGQLVGNAQHLADDLAGILALNVNFGIGDRQKFAITAFLVAHVLGVVEHLERAYRLETDHVQIFLLELDTPSHMGMRMHNGALVAREAAGIRAMLKEDDRLVAIHCFEQELHISHNLHVFGYLVVRNSCGRKDVLLGADHDHALDETAVFDLHIEVIRLVNDDIIYLRSETIEVGQRGIGVAVGIMMQSDSTQEAMVLSGVMLRAGTVFTTFDTIVMAEVDEVVLVEDIVGELQVGVLLLDIVGVLFENDGGLVAGPNGFDFLGMGDELDCLIVLQVMCNVRVGCYENYFFLIKHTESSLDVSKKWFVASTENVKIQSVTIIITFY